MENTYPNSTSTVVSHRPIENCCILAAASVYQLVCSNGFLFNYIIACLLVTVQEKVFASFKVNVLSKYGVWIGKLIHWTLVTCKYRKL
jgi:hypothetical protein